LVIGGAVDAGLLAAAAVTAANSIGAIASDFIPRKQRSGYEWFVWVDDLASRPLCTIMF
jgi:hypothetical protein